MPNPTRPNSYPLWTQGNNAVRQQPTNGEQFTGFTPNFRPPSGWHNWLFGIVSDWISWLDFVTTGGALPISNVSHNILTGTTAQAQLDETDAFLSSLGIEYLVVTPTNNPLVFTLDQAPVNSSDLFVFSDGQLVRKTGNWSYAVIAMVPTLTFTAGNAPAPGQQLDVATLTASQPGAGGSAVSGGFVAVGDAGAPVAVPAAAGVLQYNNQRTLLFTVSTGGVTPVTSAPQVAAGTKVGQELRIVGTSDVNAITFVSGNGLLLNGPITMGNGVSLDLYWNGLVWAESDRSN